MNNDFLLKIFQLYCRGRIVALRHLFVDNKGGPELASMLSGYALRRGDRDLAEQSIPKIADDEERSLKARTLELLDALESPFVREPRVHLLILACNREQFVEHALRQLAATDYGNYAVYVMDNGSTDKTGEIVARCTEFFPPSVSVSVESMPFNVGRPLGHNFLIANHDHADAEFIAIGDDDLIDVPRDWLKRMVATARLFPNAAVVGGKALSPGHDKIIHGGVRRLLHYEAQRGMRMTGDGEEADFGQHDYIDLVDHVIGCLHLYRTSALLKDVGLFDIRYSPCQCVDIDHHFRTRQLGFDIVYNGLVEFVHARAMGNSLRHDIALVGNSQGNLIKLLYKFDDESMHRVIASTAQARKAFMEMQGS